MKRPSAPQAQRSQNATLELVRGRGWIWSSGPYSSTVIKRRDDAVKAIKAAGFGGYRYSGRLIRFEDTR